MNDNNHNIESDRRLVTVMFADISGFTAMSEKMDPEEVTEVMKDCFSMMGECIEEHGGTIDKFMGDCVMVLFGAPKAQENAPHHALNTALEIRKRLKEFNEKKRLSTPLNIHIGINTGPVIAGMMGSDKRQDFTVMGDTVNLASRMESTAETGDILVAEDTYRLTEGFFDFEPIGRVKVKGKEQPVKAYKVIGPKRTITRIEASMEKGLSPFVGRTVELQQMGRCLEQASEGHGQVVGVMGEPGVGKSRLIRQFKESLPDGEYTWIEGGCIHFGDTIPYLPILDMLKDYFDIKEDENEAAIKEKINKKVTRLSDQLAPILPPLHEILSLKVGDEEYVKLDAKQRHDRVFEAIRMLLIAESQNRPLVVIIEDLHWIDKTSEEFLTYLIGSLATTRILLLLLFRPEYIPSWSGKTYYSQIRVDQLPRKTTADLVRGILKSEDVESELDDFIANKTEGNPLFIEELTYNLLENGAIKNNDNRYSLSLRASDIQVPATIQGIIAARLDRLEGNLKKILQVASVIGREFAFRILQSVAAMKEDLKSSMLTLQDLEFIYEKAFLPELEYIFKHALTREVAYSSLLIKKRKETHEKVGQAIETIYAERLEEFYEMLAYHYALSENSQKAVQYLKLSGDKAAQNYSNWEAVRFYKETIRILKEQPESENCKTEMAKLCISANTSLFVLGYPEGSLEILQEAERLAEELGDEWNLTGIYSTLGFFHSYKGDPIRGMEYFEKYFHKTEKVESIRFRARGANAFCAALWLASDYVRCVEIGYKGLRLLEEHHKEKEVFMGKQNIGYSIYSSITGWCGGALTLLGRFSEAREMLENGLRIAYEINDKLGIAVMEFASSDLSFWKGNGNDTCNHAQKAVTYYEETGDLIIIGAALTSLGSGFFLLGEHEKALNHADKGLKIKDFPAILSWNYWHSAYIHLAAGDQVKAREYFETALKLSMEFHVKACEGVARILLGVLAGKAKPEQIDNTIQQIQQGFLILEDRELKALIALGYLHLGELFFDVGCKEKALENLKKAEALYLEMKVTPKSHWLVRTKEALAKLQ